MDSEKYDNSDDVTLDRDIQVSDVVIPHPLVSVILCNYNYGDYIGEAIESVLRQDYENFELIIVDDGSTDHSRDVIASFEDARIKTICQENIGQSGAFNAAYCESKGDIICFLDSDDWWADSKLERVVAWDRLLKGDYAVLQHEVLVWDKGITTPYKGSLPNGDCFAEMLRTGNVDFFVPTSGLAFRRSVLDRVMPIPAELKIAADAYITRAAFVFGKVESISECLGYYRKHENTVYKNSSFDAGRFFRDQLFPLLNAFYDREGIGYQLDVNCLGQGQKREMKSGLYGARMDLIDEVMLCHQYLCNMQQGIMVDVGAHEGGSAKMFLDSGWIVHAFEPDPQNRAALEVIRKNHPKLHIDGRAVNDKIARDVPFFTSNVSTGISSLSAFHSSHQETTRVDTITLAQFCDEHCIDKVDFLKVDTEGFDFMVLKGVPWEKITPDVILCEFEDRKTLPLGYSYTDMADYLVSKGYEVLISDWQPIEEYGKTHRWRDFRLYPCNLGSSDDWGNMLAFRGGIDWPLLLNALHAKSAVIEEQIREQELSDQLYYMRNSMSWRITKPLRFIKAKLTKAES